MAKGFSGGCNVAKNPPRHKNFDDHAEAPLLIGNSSMLRTHGSKRKRSTRNSDASTARHEEKRWIRKLDPDELHKRWLSGSAICVMMNGLEEKLKVIFDNVRSAIDANDLSALKAGSRIHKGGFHTVLERRVDV